MLLKQIAEAILLVVLAVHPESETEQSGYCSQLRILQVELQTLKAILPLLLCIHPAVHAALLECQLEHRPHNMRLSH